MTRTEEIHATWARFRGPWPTRRGAESDYFLPCVVLAIHRPLPKVVRSKSPPTYELTRDNLTFTREPGFMDGKPWYRIVCEGVVVEDGPA